MTPMKKSANTPFEEWFAEVVRIAREDLAWKPKALASLPSVAPSFRELYYDEDTTPREAWQEEYSAAQ